MTQKIKYTKAPVPASILTGISAAIVNCPVGHYFEWEKTKSISGAAYGAAHRHGYKIAIRNNGDGTVKIWKIA